MQQKPLNGKTAVVTGAGRGIGRASCLALAAAGANIAAAARTQSDLDSLAAEIEKDGGAVLTVAADVSREEDAERLRAETVARFKRADILVLNAGVGKYGPLSATSTEDYDRMMNTNMRSTFLCARAFFPPMLEAGAGNVIFIASVAGMRGLPNESVYCASKCAQVGFAQALDYEARPRGVKVSVLAPGGVNTHFALGPGEGRTAGDPKLAKMLDAEDVAAAVVFAATQPEKSRVFLLGMRPMNEEL